MTYQFPHERMAVNDHALALAVLCQRLIEQFPRGYGVLADQLRRASLSVALNVGEGANQMPSKRKTHAYRIARAECGEVAVALKLAAALDLGDVAEALDRCEQTYRILTKLT